MPSAWLVRFARLIGFAELIAAELLVKSCVAAVSLTTIGAFVCDKVALNHGGAILTRCTNND